MQFSAEGSQLRECRFVGAFIEHASFGAGRSVSQYLRCNFSRAKLRMGPGGYARFIDCTFEETRIENWFCFAVELVDCTFSGQLRKVILNGTARPEDVEVTGSSINRIEANDFSRAELIEVSFRTGVVLTDQQLPSGPQYTLLKDGEAAVKRAREAFDSWEDANAKKRARGLLMVMERDVALGQRQLLIRVDDYPRQSRPAIRALLDAAQAV